VKASGESWIVKKTILVKGCDSLYLIGNPNAAKHRHIDVEKDKVRF